MNLLSAQQLSFGFDSKLLFQHLDLSLRGGTVLHIRGANGVGKTTLLRILAGLLLPHSGSVLWEGQPIKIIQSQFVQKLIYLGTKLGIEPLLSVRENIQLQSILAGGRDDIVMDDVLQQLNLSDYADQSVGSLSTGLARRVALCRLIAIKRVLWLLDEPFLGLDTTSAQWLSTQIAHHVKQGGIVIFTSHQSIVIEQTSVEELLL